jgi:hypothetical protein
VVCHIGGAEDASGQRQDGPGLHAAFARGFFYNVRSFSAKVFVRVNRNTGL